MHTITVPVVTPETKNCSHVIITKERRGDERIYGLLGKDNRGNPLLLLVWNIGAEAHKLMGGVHNSWYLEDAIF